jgi:hypothetical protein
MKNKPEDLHNLLFAELERLSEVSTDGDAIYKESVRAKAVCEVAMQIIAHEKQVLSAYEAADGSFCKMKLPDFMAVDATAATGKPTITKKDRLLLVRKDA